jgi:hypothetical protein
MRSVPYFLARREPRGLLCTHSKRSLHDNREPSCNTCGARRHRLLQMLDHSSSRFLSENLLAFVTVHWLNAGYSRIIQKREERQIGLPVTSRYGSSLFPIESQIEELICQRRILGSSIAQPFLDRGQQAMAGVLLPASSTGAVDQQRISANARGHSPLV